MLSQVWCTEMIPWDEVPAGEAYYRPYDTKLYRKVKHHHIEYELDTETGLLLGHWEFEYLWDGVVIPTKSGKVLGGCQLPR